MTLHFRNRLNLFFIGSFCLCLVALLVFAIVNVKTGVFLLPPSFSRAFKLSDTNVFFANNFVATVFSLCFLLLFGLIGCICSYFLFEKTQCTPIVFFIGFAVCTFLDGTRLLIPIFALYNSATTPLIFLTRLVVFARIAASLCFFFCAVASEKEQRQDTERNLCVILALSLIFAAKLPIDSDMFFSCLLLSFDYGKIYTLFFALITLTTLTGFAISTYKSFSKQKVLSIAGFLLIITGFSLLSKSDSWAFFVLGSLFMSFGAYTYLVNLHKIYLWL